jgi:hypothetical protein
VNLPIAGDAAIFFMIASAFFWRHFRASSVIPDINVNDQASKKQPKNTKYRNHLNVIHFVSAVPMLPE